MENNDSDWTELLISVVETKPELYDKSLSEYANKDLRRKSWAQVCKLVVDNWENLTPEERTHKCNDVQNRWKNLRTCFARELREQKKASSGLIKKKRRKYLFYEKLMFLLPMFEDKEITVTGHMQPLPPPPPAPTTLDHTQPPASSSTHDDTMDDDVGEMEDGEVQGLSQPPRPSSGVPPRPKKKAVSYEQSLLDILKEKQEDVDEDKYFLLSLLPPLKRLNPELKFEAKIELMKVMNGFEITNSSGSLSHPHHSNQNFNLPVFPNNDNH